MDKLHITHTALVLLIAHFAGHFRIPTPEIPSSATEQRTFATLGRALVRVLRRFCSVTRM